METSFYCVLIESKNKFIKLIFSYLMKLIPPCCRRNIHPEVEMTSIDSTKFQETPRHFTHTPHYLYTADGKPMAFPIEVEKNLYFEQLKNTWG